MKLNESYMARRRFLCGMLGGGAVAMGVSVSAPLVPYVGNLREEPLPPFKVLQPADYKLAPGTYKIVPYGPIPALLIQTPEPDSQLKAFVGTCTHFDCPVGYKPAENRIYCACHEGYYDVDGQVISGPPPSPLRKFYHELRDGEHGKELIIALEREDLEKAFDQA